MTKRCETVITYANSWTIGGRQQDRRRCMVSASYRVTDLRTGQKLVCCSSCLIEFRRINAGELEKYRIILLKGATDDD